MNGETENHNFVPSPQSFSAARYAKAKPKPKLVFHAFYFLYLNFAGEFCFKRNRIIYAQRYFKCPTYRALPKHSRRRCVTRHCLGPLY